MSRLADLRWMDAALALGRSGLGTTAPNPSVGCLIVHDDVVLGRGVTAPGGRPHAERIALDEAGSLARGATAYVTLEPCAHFGQTPPCADALIDAGIARVVVACSDPDPRTAGQGMARMRQAGITVDDGVRHDAGATLNAGFFRRVLERRPLIAIDSEPNGYDASFDVIEAASPDRWVADAYSQGLTRVRLVPDSPAATALEDAGLVDVVRP